MRTAWTFHGPRTTWVSRTELASAHANGMMGVFPVHLRWDAALSPSVERMYTKPSIYGMDKTRCVLLAHSGNGCVWYSMQLRSCCPSQVKNWMWTKHVSYAKVSCQLLVLSIVNWLEAKAPTCYHVSEMAVEVGLWLSMESFLVMRKSFTLIKEGLLGKGLGWIVEFARGTFTCIIARSLEAHRAGFPCWLVDILPMAMSVHLSFIGQHLLQQSGLIPYFALFYFDE